MIVNPPPKRASAGGRGSGVAGYKIRRKQFGTDERAGFHTRNVFCSENSKYFDIKQMADEKILITAAAYLNCAFEIALYNLEKINLEIMDYQNRGVNTPGPETAKSIVKTVNVSLACELAFKSMLPKLREHRLDELYKKLLEVNGAAAVAIRSSVISELQITEDIFEDTLKKCTDNFVFYRYFYEGTGLDRVRPEQLDNDGYRWDYYKFVKVLTQQILIYNERKYLIEEYQTEYIEKKERARQAARLAVEGFRQSHNI